MFCQFDGDGQEGTEIRVDNVGEVYLCPACAREWDEFVKQHGQAPYRCTGCAEPGEPPGQ